MLNLNLGPNVNVRSRAKLLVPQMERSATSLNVSSVQEESPNKQKRAGLMYDPLRDKNREKEENIQTLMTEIQMQRKSKIGENIKIDRRETKFGRNVVKEALYNIRLQYLEPPLAPRKHLEVEELDTKVEKEHDFLGYSESESDLSSDAELELEEKNKRLKEIEEAEGKLKNEIKRAQQFVYAPINGPAVTVSPYNHQEISRNLNPGMNYYTYDYRKDVGTGGDNLQPLKTMDPQFMGEGKFKKIKVKPSLNMNKSENNIKRYPAGTKFKQAVTRPKYESLTKKELAQIYRNGNRVHVRKPITEKHMSKRQIMFTNLKLGNYKEGELQDIYNLFRLPKDEAVRRRGLIEKRKVVLKGNNTAMDLDEIDDPNILPTVPQIIDFNERRRKKQEENEIFVEAFKKQNISLDEGERTDKRGSDWEKAKYKKSYADLKWFWVGRYGYFPQKERDKRFNVPAPTKSKYQFRIPVIDHSKYKLNPNLHKKVIIPASPTHHQGN